RFRLQALARDRVREREPRGVEELALEAEVAGTAVHRIARDREADRLEMDADLVRAAGLERDAEERVAAQQLDDLEMRQGLERRARRLRRLELELLAALELPALGARPAVDEDRREHTLRSAA